MNRPDFEVGDYVCEMGIFNKVLIISEVEYFKDLDDYVYYTTNGRSFGKLQLEPMEIVYKSQYEKQMTSEKQIEEILTEASAYGLRLEVIELAKTLMAEGYNKLHAYEMAFNEWVK
jgi:hypothetical protein